MAIPLKYNLRSLLLRKATTGATAGGVALVVMVTMLLLSLVISLKRVLVATGSADNLVVMRKGATSETASFILRDAVQALQYLPGIRRTAEGAPLVSPELVTQPLCQTTAGKEEIVLVRGVTPSAFLVHNNVRLVAGRTPQPSLGEAAVGIAASHRYAGARVGETLRFGRRTWTVVGLFAADGSAFESEVWVDIDDLFTDTNYGGYSSVTLTIAPGADRDALSRRIAEDPRISLQARSEVDYYREQAGDGDTLYLLTVALAGIMGTGAVFAALNTMSAAVVARTAEIGTLRALGFRRGAVLHSFISESVCISLMGYIWGVALGVGAVTLINLVMRGVAFQRRGFTTVVVTLHLSLSILLATLLLAVLIGIFAGLLPAYQAARLRVTEALRRAG